MHAYTWSEYTTYCGLGSRHIKCVFTPFIKFIYTFYATPDALTIRKNIVAVSNTNVRSYNNNIMRCSLALIIMCGANRMPNKIHAARNLMVSSYIFSCSVFGFFLFLFFFSSSDNVSDVVLWCLGE